MIPRYSLDDGVALHRRGALRPLARGRDPRGRGVGRARCGPAEPTPSRSASGPASTSPRSRSASASPSTTSPRSSTSCRSGSGQPEGAWVHYGLTSSDVVDTALVAAARRRRRDLLLDAAADARGRDHRPGARVRRHADGRAHARHPRRADDVRRQARALGAPGARATSSGCAERAGRIAVGKLSGAVGTYSNVDPSVEQYVCERLGLDAGARDPGARPRPPRRAALRVRVGRRERSSRSRPRSATSSAPRCARWRSRSGPGSRRARRRCRTSATR